MKKAFLSIMMAFMACIMCVSLVGCGVNAKSVKGEIVTEEEWIAALEAILAEDAAFTVEYSSVTSGKYMSKTMVNTTKCGVKNTTRLTLTKNGTSESAIGYEKVSYTGDKKAAEILNGEKAKKKDIEEYSLISEENIYNYEKGRDDKWTSQEAYRSVVYSNFTYKISSLKDSYSYYVYSIEHNGYISKYYDDDNDSVTVYKFKDGKLVAIYAYTDYSDLYEEGQMYTKTSYTQTTNYTISYTAKDITLPPID